MLENNDQPSKQDHYDLDDGRFDNEEELNRDTKSLDYKQNNFKYNSKEDDCFKDYETVYSKQVNNNHNEELMSIERMKLIQEQQQIAMLQQQLQKNLQSLNQLPKELNQEQKMKLLQQFQLQQMQNQLLQQQQKQHQQQQRQRQQQQQLQNNLKLNPQQQNLVLQQLQLQQQLQQLNLRNNNNNQMGSNQAMIPNLNDINLLNSMMKQANQQSFNNNQTKQNSIFNMINNQKEAPRQNEVKSLPNVKTLEEIEAELLKQANQKSQLNNQSNKKIGIL